MASFAIICLCAILSASLIPTSSADLRSLLHRLMYTSGDADTDAANFSEQDITVELLSANRTGLQPCDDNRLMLRLAQMQIISPERIVLLVLNSGGLVELCRSLKTNIEATTFELRNCAPFEADNLYWLLFRGVGVLYRQLCLKDTELTQKLELHGVCIRDLREEFVDCEGPADWFEKGDAPAVCQSFEDIVNCQYVKTAELCGLEPANVMRCIAVDVLNGSLLHPCNSQRMVMPRVDNPMPGNEHSVDNGVRESQSNISLLNILSICLGFKAFTDTIRA